MAPHIFLNISFCFLLLYLSFSCSSVKTKGSPSGLKNGISPLTFDHTRVKEVSWQPRSFLYKNFLTDEECDHLINLAKDLLGKSLVVDDESGKSIESKERTSSGMFLFKYQDKIVSNIEARIAAWTFLPEENGERMQILRYEKGEKYEPHFDFFTDKVNIEVGGNRLATVLMYLSNVEEGGETVFPMSKGIMYMEENGGLANSNCAKKGYAVKPEKGDALLFFNLHPNGTIDTYSLHESCPVIKGEKWSATKWIHVRSYETYVEHAARSVCIDKNVNCPVWAEAGECKNKPDYMVGYDGFCRKSCNACSS